MQALGIGGRAAWSTQASRGGQVPSDDHALERDAGGGIHGQEVALGTHTHQAEPSIWQETRWPPFPVSLGSPYKFRPSRYSLFLRDGPRAPEGRACGPMLAEGSSPQGGKGPAWRVTGLPSAPGSTCLGVSLTCRGQSVGACEWPFRRGRTSHQGQETPPAEGRVTTEFPGNRRDHPEGGGGKGIWFSLLFTH